MKSSSAVSAFSSLLYLFLCLLIESSTAQWLRFVSFGDSLAIHVSQSKE